MASRSRAKQYGGGGGGGFLRSYFGNIGSQVVPEEEEGAETDKSAPAKTSVKFKPKSGFMNFLSAGQGTAKASALNNEQLLDQLQRERDFVDTKRKAEFEDPREILKREGIIPDEESAVKFKEATTTPRISAARERSLLEGETSANERGNIELAARKRHMTAENQITQAAMESARGAELSKAALEATPLDIINAKMQKSATPAILNAERNKAALMPVSEGTSLYDVNQGRVVSKSPKSVGQEALRESLGITPKAPQTKPIVPKDQIEWDIVMVNGKPVKVLKKKAAPAVTKNY